ncbi:uncharacterized protein LOC119398612 [Rhipicephalus sanguineus]|uniref:uncharacterized protein LOC119398612 n=1 Tax=Rhipicephalus sanguineus TaxID=34632 RepID=UPI00189616EF|nr:uncharacterized protein LOC119398612 [Rhipicephalus sanguineus]
MPQHLRNSNTKKILKLHLGAFPGADLGTVRGADQEAKPEGPHNLGVTVTRRPPGRPPKPVIHWSRSTKTGRANAQYHGLGCFPGLQGSTYLPRRAADKQLLSNLVDKYLGDQVTQPQMPYTGQDNASLDAPITLAEVQATVRNRRPNSAPGDDCITNRILQNADDDSLATLLQHINIVWESGSLPAPWKHAKIVFIPKPGKPLHFDNLRPISLTSCVGKVMEHVILTRLTEYMDKEDKFPHTMIGFRPRLSTQDVMLQLQHQVLDTRQGPKLDTRAVLGLDLTKAFDNVTHRAILEALSELNVGAKTYSYIKDFLSNRTATLTIGGLQSEVIKLGSKGTPQGSVLSPMLLNIALMGLPTQLSAIPRLNHCLYADDITLWTAGGSDGEIEETLQEAINAVVEYVEPRGLSCSSSKSELLIIRPATHRRTSQESTHPIMLEVKGHPIPCVPSLRVLGLRIQQNRKNTEIIECLKTHATQIGRLIARIANKHMGMKEDNLLRLVQAFIISRIAYVAPFLCLSNAEKHKINIIIKKAYKQALHVPQSTENQKLMELGLHNTIEELIEAQRISHYERLSQTQTGRHILRTLDIEYVTQTGPKVPLSKDVRETFLIPPIPRNMHPVYNAERRADRAKHLSKSYKGAAHVAYVDAAEYPQQPAMALAVVTGQNHVTTTTSSLLTTQPEEGEEAAIALAYATTTASCIVSDSITAIRNFTKGIISPQANRILTGSQKPHLL